VPAIDVDRTLGAACQALKLPLIILSDQIIESESVLEGGGGVGHLPFSTILCVLSFCLSALTNPVDDDAGPTKRESISASYPTAAKAERGKE
jgi:hypothetical protein